MNDSLSYIIQCYNLLKEMNIIESKYQFSRQFLNSCPNYYSVMISQNRKVPNHMLHYLNKKIKQISECFNDKRIKPLLIEGVDLLNKRLEKFVK